MSYGNYDNRRVHLGQVSQAFQKFDKDHNGLSKNEINFAINDAKKSGNKNLYEFWSTLVFGGKDGNGLMPDINKDGRVQFFELKDLANHSKSRHHIDASDFLAGFGYDAKPGGNPLPSIGGGYPAPPPQPYPQPHPHPVTVPAPGPYPMPPGRPAPYPQPPSVGGYPPSPPGGGGQQGGLHGIMNTIMQLFQQLIPLLQQGGPNPVTYY